MRFIPRVTQLLLALCLMTIGYQNDARAEEYRLDVTEAPAAVMSVDVFSRPAPMQVKGFYLARPDMRKCVSPLCGGYFVQAVNQPVTRCADGSWAKECYVATVSWESLGYDPLAEADDLMSGAYLLKGHIEPKEYGDFGNLGVFIAKGAYRPAGTNAPQGLFAGLEPNGIMCITTPCFSVREYTLNRAGTKTISAFDLSPALASDEDVEAALDLYGRGLMLIAVGRNQRIKEANGMGITFVANQFYLPIKDETSACGPGYEERDGVCLTPHECEAPLIELATYAGIVQDDPITGEPIAVTIDYSCIESCDYPAEQTGPARCALYAP